MTGVENTRMFRSRLFIVVTMIVIVALSIWLISEVHVIGKQWSKDNKHSFYEYVVTHHLGKLEEIDDGTGLDPLSYVITLNKDIPTPQLQSYVYDLFEHYVDFDHGQTLTVMEPIVGGHPRTVAQAHYDDDAGILTLQLTPVHQTSRIVILHPHW